MATNIFASSARTPQLPRRARRTPSLASRRLALAVVLTAAALLGVGCGDAWDLAEHPPVTRPPTGGGGGGGDDGSDDEGAGGGNGGGGGTGSPSPLTPSTSGALRVELQGTPEVAWNRSNGRTDVVAQFIIRDLQGIPVEPDSVIIDLLVDGQPVDNEGLFREDAEELSSSLRYALVLDASYSMTQHAPPAFVPMLAAAADSVEAASALWRDAPGEFSWTVTWFDDFVYSAVGAWDALSLLEIPTPMEGSATRLFGAVQLAADALLADYYDGVAAGPRDHHVMVVFSDGADNISWFDNSAEGSDRFVTTPSRAEYDRRGFEAVDGVEALVERLALHPNLTVHVIGLGSAIDNEELAALAEAGGGIFHANPSATEIDALFERITMEFSTLQTRGATIPLRPGDYTFSVRARRLDGTGLGEAHFELRAGDQDSRVLD
jgi:hypothetical protein